MGIILAFAVPAFQTMGRGTAIRTASTQLAATMTYARQQAVATRQNVYVVFPNLQTYSNSEETGMALRSYNVYGERDGYMRNWTYLPKGVVFVNSQADFPDPAARDSKSIFAPGSAIAAKVTKDMPFPENDDGTRSLKVIAFAPDGSVFAVDGNLRGPDADIYMTEGNVLVNGNVPQAPEYRGVENNSLYTVSLNPLTGQAKIVDLRYF